MARRRVLRDLVPRGLAPVLVLENHRNAYYLVYSLPAFAILDVGAITTAVRLLVRDGRLAGLVTAAAVGIGIVVTTGQVYALERAVRDRPAWGLVGAGLYPFALGQSVERTRAALERDASALAPGAWIVLHGVDAVALLTSAAPRVWYGDPGLEAYESNHLAIDGEAVLAASDPPRSVDLETALLVQPASATSRELVVIPQPEHLRAVVELASGG